MKLKLEMREHMRRRLNLCQFWLGKMACTFQSKVHSVSFKKKNKLAAPWGPDHHEASLPSFLLCPCTSTETSQEVLEASTFLRPKWGSSSGNRGRNPERLGTEKGRDPGGGKEKNTWESAERKAGGEIYSGGPVVRS